MQPNGETTNPPHRRPPWRLAGIAAAAGLIGGVAGALLVGIGQRPPGPAPATSPAATAHAQDVALCTTYALITANLPGALDIGMNALPAIAPLRLALIENPDADPQIRKAIDDAVAGFDAILAKDAQPRGLSEPPAYDQKTVTAAFDRVAQACGLTR